jgi:uncharacterized protein
MSTLEAKKARLDLILDDLGSVLVAYSGGVDSAFLLKAAYDRLGAGNAVGLIAVSPSLPRAEFEEALETARAIGCRLEVADAHEHENPEYAANTPNRCYFCKTELFDICGPAAARLGLRQVVYGANVDDLGDFRPGMQAARERKIRAPLLEAGLSKADVRELSRRAHLKTWDKPAFACLASRIPHGTAVTPERLERVESAEAFLRSRGFRQFRVRDLFPVARVEVSPEDIPRMAADPLRSEMESHFRELGFPQVLIDPEGYRPGKLNESAALRPSGGDAPRHDVPDRS